MQAPGGAAGSGSAAAVLASIDSAASCAICHSVFDTPLLLKSCGHSYCSTCIRQNLAFQERSGPPSCPTCRKPCDARDLLPNAALREVLDKYVASRPLLLAAAESAAAGQQQALEAAAEANAAGCRQSPPRRQSGRKRHRQQQQQQQQQPGDSEGGTGQVMAGPGGNAVTRRRTRSASATGTAGQAVTAGSGSVDIDLAGDSSSGWSEDDASASISSEADSSGCEASPSSSFGPPPKRQGRPPSRGRQSVPAQQLARNEAPPAGGASTPSGFVRCPVCSKTVPSFFINSHVDLCLVGAQPSKPAGTSAAPATASGSRQAAATAAAAGPFQPLAVPPKLVPSLTTEKSLRQQLRKYSMPTDGKKKELLERYSKLRLAVEMANDKQERITYEQLAKRVAAQERQLAAVQLLQPVGKAAPAAAAGAAAAAGRRSAAADAGGTAAALPRPQTGAAPGALAVADDEVTNPAHILVSGSGSFRELIEVTRRRDAVRRRLRAQQQQQQQQQQRQPDPAEEEEEQQQQQQALPQDEVQEDDVEQQQQQAQLDLSEELDTLDGSSDAWDAGLPLSQSLLPEWEERQRARKTRLHRLAAVGLAAEGQQEQYPPNTAMQSRPHSPSEVAAGAGACAAAGVAAGEVASV